jgi:formylglycine-generating enzyme required for sulfatase activity
MGGKDRVFRGYSRAWKAPGDRTDDIGFRVAKSG